MSKTNASRIAITYDPASGFPLASEVTDTNNWPSESATYKALSTIVEIYNQGYTGLKLQCTSLENNETLWSRSVNAATPEGHIVICVMGLAEYGFAIPTETVMDLLRKLYDSEGLQPPTPRCSKEKI